MLRGIVNNFKCSSIIFFSPFSICASAIFSFSCLSLPFHSIYDALLETHRRKSNRKCDLLHWLHKVANLSHILCEVFNILSAFERIFTSHCLCAIIRQSRITLSLYRCSLSVFVLLNCNLSLSVEHSELKT